jgi:hypothetical protein
MEFCKCEPPRATRIVEMLRLSMVHALVGVIAVSRTCDVHHHI